MNISIDEKELQKIKDEVREEVMEEFSILIEKMVTDRISLFSKRLEEQYGIKL